MVAWSSTGLRVLAGRNVVSTLVGASKNEITNKARFVPVRTSGHHNTLVIYPSKYQFTVFKDFFNFYLLIGLVPMGLIITYVNIFIGDAELAEIPEGYEPKPWEYYQHPISRFFAKYLTPNKQEVYERNLHNIFVLQQQDMIKKLELKVKNLIKDREDYQAWYYEKPLVKYGRAAAEITEREVNANLDRRPGTIS